MNCQLTSFEMLDFHFGSIASERRTIVEGHLLECKDCLKQYLNLKADVELNHTGDTQPSPFMRHRIRAEFSAYAAEQEENRVIGLFKFPPKIVMTGVAAAATIVLVIASITFRKNEGPDPLSTISIDQARTLDDAIDSGSRNPDNINML